MLSRRAFDTLAMAGVASSMLALALTAGPALAQSADGSSVTIPADKLGVVGFTIRDQLEEAPRETLQAVTECGITNIEFSGSDLEASPPSFQNVEVPAIVEFADEFGFNVPSIGVGSSDLTERLDVVIDVAKTLGASYVRISGIEGVEGETQAEYYSRLATVLNEAGAALAAEGITLAYHNHDQDFRYVGDGRSGYDVLLEEVDPANAAFELDLYWAIVGNANPIELLQENPGRFPLYHVKDAHVVGEGRDEETTMTTVGQGFIDFAEIFELNEEAGVEYFFIENDRPLPDGVTSTCEGLEYLTATFTE